MDHSTAIFIYFNKLLATLLADIVYSNSKAQTEKMSGETVIGFELDVLP
jgi:hypothetical protein